MPPSDELSETPNFPRARERMPAFTGGVLFYATTGLAVGLIMGAFTLQPAYLAVTMLIWPFYAVDVSMWLAIAIGIVTGAGVVSMVHRSSIPISAPSRLPTLSSRQFATFLATLGLAELISRAAAGGFLVLYLFLFPTHKGEPTLSPDALITYYWEGTGFLMARWGSAHVSLVTRMLPDIRPLAAGETGFAYALTQVGDVQFFGGVAFAILFAYFTALPVAYMIVRSSWRVYDSYAGE